MTGHEAASSGPLGRFEPAGLWPGRLNPLDLSREILRRNGSDRLCSGSNRDSAIPTHLPDGLDQSADYLPGFAAAPMRMLKQHGTAIASSPA